MYSVHLYLYIYNYIIVDTSHSAAVYAGTKRFIDLLYCYYVDEWPVKDDNIVYRCIIYYYILDIIEYATAGFWNCGSIIIVPIY